MICIDCQKGKCPYWCPIHAKHHPVQDMVTYCLEKATDPAKSRAG